MTRWIEQGDVSMSDPGRVVVLLATDLSRVMLGCVMGGRLRCCCATRMRGRTMPAPHPVPVREPGFTVCYVQELG